MIDREFEGKTEREAIEKAANALGLQPDQFDVEILESVAKQGLFFKRSLVKIKVHLHANAQPVQTPKSDKVFARSTTPVGELEEKAVDFLTKTIEFMGYPNKVQVIQREEGKFTLDIVSEHASILIGKKSKNLDALQLLVNVYMGALEHHGAETVRVVVDTENYRERREQTLVELANRLADTVVRTKSSRLLEPMNPFERRLIHTTLSQRSNIVTQSEGEGSFRQVRILYQGNR